MRIAISGIVTALFLVSTPGLADAAEPVGVEWNCAAPQVWSDKTLKPVSNLTLNNFFFAEKDSSRSAMKALELSYSVTNRDSALFDMTGQFVGYDIDRNVLFAMSVSPRSAKAPPGTRTASGSVYLDAGVLHAAVEICAAFAVEARR